MIGMPHVGDFGDCFRNKLPHLRRANQVATRSVSDVRRAITRIQYGSDPPYDYGDHAIHAGVGNRVFLFPGAALRLEGRAIFAPQTDPRFGGRWAGHVVGSFGLSMFTGRRANR